MCVCHQQGQCGCIRACLCPLLLRSLPQNNHRTFHHSLEWTFLLPTMCTYISACAFIPWRQLLATGCHWVFCQLQGPLGATEASPIVRRRAFSSCRDIPSPFHCPMQVPPVTGNRDWTSSATQEGPAAFNAPCTYIHVP